MVVILVIGAIMVKVEDRGWDAVFHAGDASMLAGALLAIVGRKIFLKKHNQNSGEEK